MRAALRERAGWETECVVRVLRSEVQDAVVNFAAVVVLSQHFREERGQLCGRGRKGHVVSMTPQVEPLRGPRREL